MAAVASVAVVLLSMGSPAMADIQVQCRVICHPKCDDFTIRPSPALRGSRMRISNDLDFFFATCKVRISSQSLQEICPFFAAKNRRK
ncbi:hypothetical protein BAE44_0015447 [Dichanthelium oligosanthes]|uniref:Uncharacterized protein n=1 Tax=Dichanthelium oligosanthes TaxID=888268 RepID=A0A1E5VEG9_9POAL|nr:hypothetical protein BAE44_0015447 [Dichanthelium oligosanthes]